MATFQQKLSISLGSAFLFMLVSLPQTYKLTDNLLPVNTSNDITNCPTNAGLLLHALVFFVLTYLSMMGADVNPGIKLKHTLYATLIFFLIASPTVYSLTGSIFGQSIADANGCPTLLGVFVHALVYCAALVGVMYLP